MISVENITKKFGDRVALDRVSFAVEKGELMGFLGPNGAGKTTTLRIITGFIPPTAGRVLIGGLDVLDHPEEVKQKIGYMPEQPPLYPDMTVREYLEFTGSIRGLRGRALHESMERVAGRCGISHVLDRLAGNLSRGYRQRVGLAQALIHDPEVLILDEPTGGLDPQQIVEIRRLIQGMAESRAVILSSHILPEVAAICDKVGILHQGRLLRMDRLETLSRGLEGGQRIWIEVARPERFDPEAVMGLEGVREVFPTDGKGYEVMGSEGHDIRERLSALLVERGAGLIEMRLEPPRLEEIYLRIISGVDR